MKKLLITLVFILISFLFACSDAGDNSESRSEADNSISTERPETVGNTKGIRLNEGPANNGEDKSANVKIPTKKECEDIATGDNLVLKSQTFPIDFKPFEGTCFVTEHNPEFDDPPLGSEIYIYKNGKRFYEFKSRYNPDSATCYVEAVGFEDVNGDDLKDIIVAGKCGAGEGNVQGNEVFINDGKDFYTSVEANDKLNEFSKIKDIANFVKNNKGIYGSKR